MSIPNTRKSYEEMCVIFGPNTMASWIDTCKQIDQKKREQSPSLSEDISSKWPWPLLHQKNLKFIWIFREIEYYFGISSDVSAFLGFIVCFVHGDFGSKRISLNSFFFSFHIYSEHPRRKSYLTSDGSILNANDKRRRFCYGENVWAQKKTQANSNFL